MSSAIVDTNMVRATKYTPLGKTEEIELTIEWVLKYVANPTASGKLPSQSDVVKFIQLCKARSLDPWEGDAYLVGYDTKDGPVFNIITAVQALLKRAELSKDFDGMESGVVVLSNNVVSNRPGSIVLKSEELIGGWAKVIRKNCSIPFYSEIPLDVYDTRRSRWLKDPSGMIQKCAKASALREAFPQKCGGLFTAEEMEIVVNPVIAEPVQSVNQLSEALRTRQALTHQQPAPQIVVQQPAAQVAQQVAQQVTQQVAAKTEKATSPKAAKMLAAEVASCDSEKLAHTLYDTLQASADIDDAEREKLIEKLCEKYPVGV
jgi:phage recombination protein Bet